MATGIVYLDVDDEITSAASRIRELAGRRVAVVLPYGSRVATSRINFRLLSRDALINEKQLAVVSGDSATRALAASAGLPVFASVPEYEASLAGTSQPGSPAATDATQPPPAAALETPARAEAEVAETPKRGGRAAGTAGSKPAGSKPAGSKVEPSPTAGSEAAATPGDAGTAGAPSSPAAPTLPWALPSDDTVRGEAPVDLPAPVREPDERPWVPEPRPVAPVRPYDTGQRFREARPGTTRGSRLPFLIVLAALALVVLVGAVAAYILLPSATVVVTPRTEPISLAAVTIMADPGATQPDAAAKVVPATVVQVEVDAKDTFPATDKRVEETAAAGTVRFSNLDFLRTNTIPAGSIVSTNAGVRFRTTATITVPRADLVGLTVFPGRRNVAVTAVEPGTAGNVEPNTIVIVPKGEDPQALKVVNPDAATGGTHEEFPKVSQEDVDGAVERLAAALDDAFRAKLADPSIAAPGAIVFDETAALGEATPTTDPGTLVGQEVESFELALTATGTVVTVDPSPVSAIADQLLRAQVDAGHQLVAGSIQVEVGEPVVSGQAITFPATATGQEVAVLDPDQLRAQIMGKPLDDARQLLSAYGEVELTAWPDWVGSVPTIADRVSVRIEQAVEVEGPGSSGGMP